MKKSLLLCILILIMSTTAFATMQLPDFIIIDNITTELATNPLEIYFEKNPSQRQKGNGRPTNCWRGYVATFEIRNGELWLNKIMVDKSTGEVDVSNLVFPNKNDRKLTWYNRTLILPSGEIIHFVPMGYGSTYEKYRTIQISSGTVVKDMRLTGEEFIRYRKEQFEKYKLTEKYKDRIKLLQQDNNSEDPKSTEALIMAFDSEYYLSENTVFEKPINNNKQLIIVEPISTDEWRVFLCDILKSKPVNKVELLKFGEASIIKLTAETETIKSGQPISAYANVFRRAIFGYSLIQYVAEIDLTSKAGNGMKQSNEAANLRVVLLQYFESKILDKSIANLTEVLETSTTIEKKNVKRIDIEGIQ